MNTLTIDKKEYAVVEKSSFLQMQEIVKNYQDGQDLLRAREDIENGDDELIPFEIVKRLHNGDNPIRVWREYRGFSLEVVASKIGLTSSALSLIETRKRELKVNTLIKLAEVLGIDIDDLV